MQSAAKEVMSRGARKRTERPAIYIYKYARWQTLNPNLLMTFAKGIAMSGDGHWLVQGIPQKVDYNNTRLENNVVTNFTGQAVVFHRTFNNGSDWERRFVLMPRNAHAGRTFLQWHRLHFAAYAHRYCTPTPPH